MTNDERTINLEQKIKTLQLTYAAALADSVVRYGNAGVLDKITEQKRAEQMNNGAALAAKLGVAEPKQAIEKTQDLFECADFVCIDTSSGFEAVATRCAICSISKQMGKYSPCQIYCLSPMEAMMKGVSPDTEFQVVSTLWESDRCIIRAKLT